MAPKRNRARWAAELPASVDLALAEAREACRPALDPRIEPPPGAAALHWRLLAARPMTDVFQPDDQPVIEAIGTTLEGCTARQLNGSLT
jgi:hypothetical protein